MGTNQPAIPQEEQSHKPIRWTVVVVIALISILGVLGPKFLWMLEPYRELVRSLPVDLQFVIHPAFRMILVALGTLSIYRMVSGSVAQAQRPTLGLKVGWSRASSAFLLGFVFTLPMLVLGLFSRSATPSHYEILYGGLSPGVTEEVFFRAFMFGFLVQAARCPMWTSAVITGVVFGLAHIDITPEEGQSILGQLNAWNAMIALGGVMFAWIYYLSKWNLWLVIALHIGMNVWWDMFDLNSTPLGGIGATLSRILPIALAVFFIMDARGRRCITPSTIHS
ncbi:MAG: CPBP family intramembrane metalloprotease [Phycisphaerales bacterium]|nr:CPBP family intramembrane metalloprotease [Phycisphaerales bacterium]